MGQNILITGGAGYMYDASFDMIIPPCADMITVEAHLSRTSSLIQAVLSRQQISAPQFDRKNRPKAYQS
jgi:hypothetical protein